MRRGETRRRANVRGAECQRTRPDEWWTFLVIPLDVPRPRNDGRESRDAGFTLWRAGDKSFIRVGSRFAFADIWWQTSNELPVGSAARRATD